MLAALPKLAVVADVEEAKRTGERGWSSDDRPSEVKLITTINAKRRKPARDGRVYWVLVGMFCGIALAVMIPQVHHARPHPLAAPPFFQDMVDLQRLASRLFWYPLTGAAVAAAIELLWNPSKKIRVRLSLKALFLFICLVASLLSACLLYIRIVKAR